MIRTICLTLVFLAISLGGGIASVWYALNSNSSFGAISIGSWTAFPDAGTPDADPYSTARRARDGELPMGQAEGLPFYAKNDSEGRTLSTQCNYRIDGNVPAARFWTMHPASPSLIAQKNEPFRNDALHSRQLLRAPDNSFSIALGPDPAPGNWISVSATGSMVLVLTLFDTQIASAVTSASEEFPAIIRINCRGG